MFYVLYYFWGYLWVILYKEVIILELFFKRWIILVLGNIFFM